jgi:addiction module HigA family antidote
VLPALGLSITEAAQQLDVARVTLSRVLNGRAAISPEMVLRIEAWLGVERGGEARMWLAEQSAYDLWQVRKAGAPKVPVPKYNRHCCRTMQRCVCTQLTYVKEGGLYA